MRTFLLRPALIGPVLAFALLVPGHARAADAVMALVWVGIGRS